MKPIKVATFDCYGTLIDWEGGAAAFLHQMIRRHGEFYPPPAREMRQRWEALQDEEVEGEYKPYASVLRSSLRSWAAEQGIRWNTREGHALEHAMSGWQPFADVVPALLRARRAGLRLVILSNADRVTMDQSLRQLAPVEFDESVVSEELRVHKPDTTFFARALDRVRAAPEEILHVAASYEHDIVPAHEMGMRTAWVNRRREDVPGKVTPDHEWRDLWGLPEMVERRDGD